MRPCTFSLDLNEFHQNLASCIFQNMRPAVKVSGKGQSRKTLYNTDKKVYIDIRVHVKLFATG